MAKSYLSAQFQGMYQCAAYNEFDSSTASVELALSDEPARLIETFSSDSLLLKPGDKLSLKCESFVLLCGHAVSNLSSILCDHRFQSFPVVLLHPGVATGNPLPQVSVWLSKIILLKWSR